MSDTACMMFCLVWAAFGWFAHEAYQDWKAKQTAKDSANHTEEQH